MKVKTDYDACPYITEGKEYKVEEVVLGCYAWIADDTDDRILILTEGTCEHLNREGTWEIVK